MKHALVVGQNEKLEAVAASVLDGHEYDFVSVGGGFEAVELVAREPFDIVLLEHSSGCPGALWRLVHTITRSSIAEALVLVLAASADEDFYAGARVFGAVVVGAPAVTVPALIDLEHTVPRLGTQPVADAG